MSAAGGYDSDLSQRKMVSGSPLVSDPVKLHISSWLVSITTSLVAMWAASLVLISDSADRASYKKQLDLGGRIEAIEGELKSIRLLNSQILKDAQILKEATGINGRRDPEGGGS